MCMISNVADGWKTANPQWSYTITPDTISRVEFEALKSELEAVKKLLKAAKIYDKETGQPDCEDEEKVALFRRLAELVGVDLSEIFEKK